VVLLSLNTANQLVEDRHALSDYIRLFPLFRTGSQLVVVGNEPVSLRQIGRRRSSVCDVATEQDAERRRIASPMFVVVLRRLCVSLYGRQLLGERTSLSTVLLPSAFVHSTAGLHQLPGSSTVVLKVKVKGKKVLDACYSAAYMSQTRDKQRFTISEVAADWHEPMMPQRIMWPSIAISPGCMASTED